MMQAPTGNVISSRYIYQVSQRAQICATCAKNFARRSIVWTRFRGVKAKISEPSRGYEAAAEVDDAGRFCYDGAFNSAAMVWSKRKCL